MKDAGMAVSIAGILILALLALLLYFGFGGRADCLLADDPIGCSVTNNHLEEIGQTP